MCVISNSLTPSENRVKRVKIQQSNGNDGWGIKRLEIQKYPGSSEYDIYALDKNKIESRFWTDGDSNYCQGDVATDGQPCCPSGRWCNLVAITALCLTYETDIRLYSESSSTTKQEIEITFNDHSNVLYELGNEKQKGDMYKECMGISNLFITSKNAIEQVKIRQSIGNDGWGIKRLEIQKYPGSTEYDTYVMDKSNMELKFWTDGDSNYCQCDVANDSYRCCSNGQWCYLYKV